MGTARAPLQGARSIGMGSTAFNTVEQDTGGQKLSQKAMPPLGKGMEFRENTRTARIQGGGFLSLQPQTQKYTSICLSPRRSLIRGRGSAWRRLFEKKKRSFPDQKRSEKEK